MSQFSRSFGLAEEFPGFTRVLLQDGPYRDKSISLPEDFFPNPSHAASQHCAAFCVLLLIFRAMDPTLIIVVVLPITCLGQLTTANNLLPVLKSLLVLQLSGSFLAVPEWILEISP